MTFREGDRVRGTFRGVPYQGVVKSVRVQLHLTDPISGEGWTVDKSLAVRIDEGDDSVELDVD